MHNGLQPDGKPICSGGAEGVLSANSFSASVISAGIPSNNGVDKYRSPVSGRIAKMFVPLGLSRAIFKAAERIPPPVEEVEAKGNETKDETTAEETTVLNKIAMLA